MNDTNKLWHEIKKQIEDLEPWVIDMPQHIDDLPDQQVAVLHEINDLLKKVNDKIAIDVYASWMEGLNNFSHFV